MVTKEELLKAIKVVNSVNLIKVDSLYLDRDTFKKLFGEGYLENVYFTTAPTWNFCYATYDYVYRDDETGIMFKTAEFGNSIKYKE